MEVLRAYTQLGESYRYAHRDFRSTPRQSEEFSIVLLEFLAFRSLYCDLTNTEFMNIFSVKLFAEIVESLTVTKIYDGNATEITPP